MDMSSLLTLYLGVSSTSAIFNLYLNYLYHKRNVVEAKKELKYDELSDTSIENLEEIDYSNSHDNKVTLLNSFIPLYNIYYSAAYMLADQEELDDMYKKNYSLIVDSTNSLEKEVRTKYLNHLRKIKNDLNIPKEYAESINNGKLNISENDYKKILKLNNINYNEDVLYSTKDK